MDIFLIISNVAFIVSLIVYLSELSNGISSFGQINTLLSSIFATIGCGILYLIFLIVKCCTKTQEGLIISD